MSKFLLADEYENCAATAKFIDLAAVASSSRSVPGIEDGASFQAAKLARVRPQDYRHERCHYVKKTDWEPHDSLLCIQTGAKVADQKRMRYDAQQFYLKSRDEMELAFKEVPEAITNTSAVAEMCEVKLPFGEDHYPIYERPIEIDSDQHSEDHANFDRCLDIYIKSKNEILVRDAEKPIEMSEAERSKLKINGLYLFELCKDGLKERYGTDYDANRAVERHQPIASLLEQQNRGQPS